MKKMAKQLKLTIVRHGETNANVAGILQGQSLDPNFRLTDLGIHQARAAGEVLRTQCWWRILCSDLPRTRETAHHILKQNEPIEYTSLIREKSFGLCEGKSKEMRSKETGLIANFIKEHGNGIIPPQSETHDEVDKRCIRVIEHIISQYNIYEQHQTASDQHPEVLIISHGGFIKRFMHTICGHKVSVVNNASISTVMVMLDRDGNSTCTPVEINNTEHLERDFLMSLSTE
mmetsp:Transcript_4973/g.6428  ORF Transcript_4973/g.6428 Transcript_4973/m.6428 type:complete len:231 (+) Transcript_4973:20-712(+)